MVCYAEIVETLGVADAVDCCFSHDGDGGVLWRGSFRVVFVRK